LQKFVEQKKAAIPFVGIAAFSLLLFCFVFKPAFGFLQLSALIACPPEYLEGQFPFLCLLLSISPAHVSGKILAGNSKDILRTF